MPLDVSNGLRAVGSASLQLSSNVARLVYEVKPTPKMNIVQAHRKDGRAEPQEGQIVLPLPFK